MEIVIVGTGASSIFATLKLIELGYKPTLIDLGEKNKKNFTRNKKTTFKNGQKILVKSNNFFKININKLKDIPPYNFEEGGFLTEWGGCILPASEFDLKDWPINLLELKPYYEFVLKNSSFIASDGDLNSFFPLFNKNNINSDYFISSGIKNLEKNLNLKKEFINKKKVYFGRSRYLISESDETLIFSFTDIQKKLLNNKKINYLSGYFLDSYEELDDRVSLKLIDYNNKTEFLICDKLFVGAGAVNSSRLFLNSQKIYNFPLKLQSTNSYFLPLVSLSRYKNENINSKPGLFLETKLPDNEKGNFIHMQISTLNQKLLNQLSFFQNNRFFLKKIINFFSSVIYILHINFNSKYSDYYEIYLDENSNLNSKYCINKEAPMLFKVLYKRLFNIFIYLKILLIYPFNLKIVQSKSYYIGGTMPMSKNPKKEFETDLLGRPKNHRNVHFIDSSTFPTIPSTTFALTIMANSVRIIEKTLK